MPGPVVGAWETRTSRRQHGESLGGEMPIDWRATPIKCRHVLVVTPLNTPPQDLRTSADTSMGPAFDIVQWAIAQNPGGFVWHVDDARGPACSMAGADSASSTRSGSSQSESRHERRSRDDRATPHVDCGHTCQRRRELATCDTTGSHRHLVALAHVASRAQQRAEPQPPWSLGCCIWCDKIRSASIAA